MAVHQTPLQGWCPKSVRGVNIEHQLVILEYKTVKRIYVIRVVKRMIKNIIRYAEVQNCSDIHIAQNQIVSVRKRGDIIFLSQYDKVNVFEIEKFLQETVGIDLDMLSHSGDIDTACTFEGKRLRANIYKSIDGICIALRLLNDEIPTIEQLRLPKEIYAFTKMKSGLVLIIGTTGSGKSTTLASILDEINRTQTVNIITVEDPVEYLHKSKQSRIMQREVGMHVPSFEAAVRSAMRQDPDVILVGELRDLETISNAITLAETGHLVFATLHAKSVAETVDRLIDVFPSIGQDQIRIQLSSVLRGVLHQRLVPDTKKGRLPLVELMMVDDVISSMIKQKQKSNALRDYIRSKKDTGCIHLVDNIVAHIKNGDLDYTTVKFMLSVEDYKLLESIMTSCTVKRGVGYGC